MANAVLILNHPLSCLCVRIVCLGSRWILINIDKKCFKKSNNFKKIEIIIPSSPFNVNAQVGLCYEQCFLVVVFCGIKGLWDKA